MRNLRAAHLIPFVTLPLLLGCPTEPPPRPKEPIAPEDEWSRIAPSKEWLHVTSDFNGDHGAECAHVLGWVKGEDGCRASLCQYGRDLAAEWLMRCSRLSGADEVGAVTAIKDKLAERAAQKPTPCGGQFQTLLEGECGEDRTCEATGQTWATRCEKREGSPLVLRLLERSIERRLPEPAPVKLDSRSCDELRAELVTAARCKDRFACTDALPRVEAYRARCEGAEERPTIASAVAVLAVVVGADKPPKPILVQPDGGALKPEEVAVPLSDGSGGVLMICDERASDLARYLAARKRCQGGQMVVARAFKVARGLEVRTGALDFPDEATFSARYPTIVAVKEVEIRDREERMVFEAEIGRAVELSRSGVGLAEAVRELVRAVNAHAAALRRSADVRAALSARDEALAPAVAELGKMKAEATMGRGVPAGDVAGLLQRGQVRVFADVSADGVVKIGVAAPASRLDATAILPRGMVGYLSALKKVRLRKLKKEVVKEAKAEGLVAAARCGEVEKTLQDAKVSLINCSFGLESCDAGRVTALTKRVDDARGAAEAAYHALDLARTGAAAEEALAISRAAEGAGCREPWW